MTQTFKFNISKESPKANEAYNQLTTLGLNPYYATTKHQSGLWLHVDARKDTPEFHAAKQLLFSQFNTSL